MPSFRGDLSAGCFLCYLILSRPVSFRVIFFFLAGPIMILILQHDVARLYELRKRKDERVTALLVENLVSTELHSTLPSDAFDDLLNNAPAGPSPRHIGLQQSVLGPVSSVFSSLSYH